MCINCACLFFGLLHWQCCLVIYLSNISYSPRQCVFRNDLNNIFFRDSFWFIFIFWRSLSVSFIHLSGYYFQHDQKHRDIGQHVVFVRKFAMTQRHEFWSSNNDRIHYLLTKLMLISNWSAITPTPLKYISVRLIWTNLNFTDVYILKDIHPLK